MRTEIRLAMDHECALCEKALPKGSDAFEFADQYGDVVVACSEVCAREYERQLALDPVPLAARRWA
jgi:hypothetical protein